MAFPDLPLPFRRTERELGCEEIIAFEKTFVHLHAGCFSIWNAIRPHTGEGKIS